MLQLLETLPDFFLLCAGNRPAHAFGTGRKNQFRTVSGKKFPAFHTHGIRHGQDQFIALDRCRDCKPDPRVSAGGLDDDGILTQQPFFFGICDHGGGNAILGASRRIEIFQLGKDVGVEIQFFLYIQFLYIQ